MQNKKPTQLEGIFKHTKADPNLYTMVVVLKYRCVTRITDLKTGIRKYLGTNRPPIES